MMWLWIQALLVCAYAQLDRDFSFQSMCNFYHCQHYRPRANSTGYTSMTGDTGTFLMGYATDTEEEARRWCEENIPFHINEAIPGSITKCKAEATLVCKKEWVQFFGRCYKVERKMMTRDDAGKFCKSEDSNIAFIHREALPLRINDYFTKVDRVWMDASEAIARDLIYDIPGGNLLLALDGYPFHLPNVAIARVKPTEKAMPLCEYTPKMTQSEANYRLRRYGEIYYPTVFTDKSAYVRTASSVNRNEDDPYSDNKYCTKVLRPFSITESAQSALPTQSFLDALSATKAEGIIRTSAFYAQAKKADRMEQNCKSYAPSAYHIFTYNTKGGPGPNVELGKSIWRPNQPDNTCDAATYSTGIVLSRDGRPGLESMSDARYAPIYCQNILANYKYGECPEGFEVFYRENLGQKWCHKYVWKDEEKRNYAAAQKECQKWGAWLSGFSDKNELEFLNGLMDKSGAKQGTDDGDTLVGARRRETCNQQGVDNKTVGYYGTGECSREQVFQWVNNAAPNPPDLLTRWWSSIEPNHGKPDEKCLVMLKGQNDWFRNGAKGNDMVFNDHYCINKKFRFFCGREAPIVEVE